MPLWIDKELSGYRPDDELPAYRILYGKVKGKILGRWIPVQFPNNEFEDKFTERRIEGSVADIEALLARDGRLTLGYPAEAQQFLQNMTDQPGAEFACFVERARLASIIDEIRNQVLRWAIALDKAGVRGDGLSFSKAEKEKAHNIIFQQSGTGSSSITIGVLGNTSGLANVATGSHPQAGEISAADLQQLLAEIRKYIPEVALSSKDAANLDSALAELDAVDLTKPIELGIVRRALGSVLSFIGNASQTVVTAGLKAYTNYWMKQHGIEP